MAYGQPAGVRSHRRGGPKKRLIVAPWIVFSTLGVLVLAGIGVGYTYLVRSSCSGEVKATIVSSPSMQPVLDSLVRNWQNTAPAVTGRCAALEIEGKDSAVMAQALGTATSGTPSRGRRPTSGCPTPSAWVRRASTAAIAERMVPDLQPSLARTPTVIAMPKPMAEALGWPRREADLAGRDQQVRRQPGRLEGATEAGVGRVQVRHDRPAAVHGRPARADGRPRRRRRRRGHPRGAGRRPEAQAGAVGLHREHRPDLHGPGQGRRAGRGRRAAVPVRVPRAGTGP